jgi:L-asparaginase II
MSPPLVVEVLRGSAVESVHEVDVSVVGRDGHRSGWGNPSRLVMARSALKPIQALPLITSGAADAFGLSDAHLALACASHGGEPVHVELVDDWLERIGCTSEDLECGPQLPSALAAGHELVRAGQTPDRRHNNCSGKHCGFLTVCRHVGLDPRGYIGVDHPLQRDLITPAIETMCGVSLDGQTPGIDGCGIPVWQFPLDRLAAGWAGMTERVEGQRLMAAMMANPFLVAGTDRCCTNVMEAAAGALVVKTGAEGVFCGAHPESGLAWAIKSRDGAQRAAEAALLWLIADLGFSINVEMPTLRNWSGQTVGSIRVRP